MRTRTIIMEIIAFLFIILWIYAAFSKLFAYETFKLQLSKSPFLTDLSVPIAIGIPAIELIVAGMLLWKPLRIWGLYVSLFLMVLFTIYIIAILNFSHYIPCSCGGIISRLSWKQHLLFNVILVTLNIIVILSRPELQKRKAQNQNLKIAHSPSKY